MQESDTRKQLLEASLRLFAERGFSAVSIRDICGQVNIRESSVYYHFKNKRAILEELQRQFETTAIGLMNRLAQSLTAPPSEGGNGFQTVNRIFFDDYLMDDFCNRFLRIMSIERYHSQEMQALYDKWMFELPLTFQRSVFTKLTTLGILPKGNGERLALAYYAPVYLCSQRYLFTGPLTEEKKRCFRASLQAHLQNFGMESGLNGEWQTL